MTTMNMYKLVCKEIEFKLLNIIHSSLELIIVPNNFKIKKKCDHFRPINTAMEKFLKLLYFNKFIVMQENILLNKY